MDIDLSNIFVQNENIITREIAGETLLVPISKELADMERIFCLNSVGKFIWHQLKGQVNLETILDQITLEFDIDRGTAENDLFSLITDLLDVGLISRSIT